MSIVFMEGGQLYEAAGGSGLTLESTPGTPWSGTNATRVFTGQGRYGNLICFGLLNLAISGTNNWTPPTTPTGHFWLNWSLRRDLNHDSNRFAHGVRVTAGGVNLTIILGNNGRAQLWTGSGGSASLVAESSAAYATGEWVDVRMRVNILSGELQAYANDDNFFTGFDAGYVGGNISLVRMGNTGVPNTGSILSNGSMFWGDIILSYDGPDLGRTAVLYLFPNADEVAQDWSPVSGVDGFAMLDANLADPVTEYVEATTVGNISQFDVEAPGIAVFGLYGVGIQSFQTKTTTATAETDFVLTVNGTDYNSPPQNLSDASYVLESYIWDQNPNTAAQWQTADIAGLRVGFEKVT